MPDFELQEPLNGGDSTYYVQLEEDTNTSHRNKRTKETNELTASIDYHLINSRELMLRYATDVESGISTDDAKRRLKRDGPNTIKPKRKIFKQIVSILSKFFTGFCIVLWPAAIMSILAYKPLGYPHPDITNLVQGIVLILVIFTNAIFEIVQGTSIVTLFLKYIHSLDYRTSIW